LGEAVDPHVGAASLGEEILDPVVEDILTLVDVKAKGRSNFSAGRENPSHEALDHRNDHLSQSERGLTGNEGAEVDHHDHGLPLFQAVDEPVLIGFPYDLPDVPARELHQGNTE